MSVTDRGETSYAEPRHRVHRTHHVVRPGRTPRPLPTFPDRTCECGTKLNHYNAGPLCYGCQRRT